MLCFEVPRKRAPQFLSPRHVPRCALQTRRPWVYPSQWSLWMQSCRSRGARRAQHRPLARSRAPRWAFPPAGPPPSRAPPGAALGKGLINFAVDVDKACRLTEFIGRVIKFIWNNYCQYVPILHPRHQVQINFETPARKHTVFPWIEDASYMKILVC